MAAVAKFAMAMIVSTDLERAKTFYRTILGLQIVTDAAPHWIDFALGDGGRLGIHPASESLRVQPGSLQLAFTVDDVDRFVTDARTAGVRILQDPHDASWGRFAVIADPDGYAVQVATFKG